jgi:hypothetical protein
LTTLNSGEFVFPDLLPGTYTLRVSDPGFQTQKIGTVEVQVARVTSLPVTLSVAQTTQTVELFAAAPTRHMQRIWLSFAPKTTIDDGQVEEPETLERRSALADPRGAERAND